MLKEPDKNLKCLEQATTDCHIGVQVMNAFKSVVDKLRNLETERRNLLLEIEELKKMADSKAKALEGEVSMLREEVKSLRVLLGTGEPELPPEPKRKK
jgi:seryl-tRNA synthetase